MNEPIISLCLPTNGMIEWVFPVLDSIFNQKLDEELFEVIVTDNGNNDDFEKKIKNYTNCHSNIIYEKTTAYMFCNQLEALKLAKGKFFKFVNHRGLFTAGSLKKMIDIILENEETKPVIYFGNGVFKKERYILDSFDSFVGTLGYFASWTTGVGIWKDDYNKISENIKIDKISPHSCILFAERKKNKYIIDNFVFSKEIETDHSKKGKYDLFKAFAVEEITITLNLYIDGDITAQTFKKVKKSYKSFVADLYWLYVIRKQPCSYDLSGFKNAMGIYFTELEIKIEIIMALFKKVFKRMTKIVRVKR